MKSLADIKRRMVPGTRLLCVENTKRRELNGTMRTVLRSGSRAWWFKVDGDDREQAGFWPNAPRVAIFDDDTFRLEMLLDPVGVTASVTLRFIAAP